MADLSFIRYLKGIYKLNLSASGKVHNAVIQAIYDCFIRAKGDIDEMRLELCLATATGKWLDYWGDFFAIYRKAEEEDINYSKRIISSVIQHKSTINAVKDNIVTYINAIYNKEYTREDISVTEPWVDIAKYSQFGALSNSARFFSSDYYSHGVMVVSIPENVTGAMVDLVNSVKAAGVKVIWSVLNSYDIITGFNDADDAYAAYSRHIQTKVQRNYYSGLTLSQSTKKPLLSGSREIYSQMTNAYSWYAVVKDKDTDKSLVITKKDLINMLEFYYDINETTGLEEMIKITDDMLQSLEFLDKFLSLSCTGRVSTSDATMLTCNATTKLFDKLLGAIERFKQEHPEYYNALQPPIETYEDKAMWLVTRNDNWIWNTPTMSIQDFAELWEPFGEQQEHTIESIAEFEDAYYKGYIAFGDKYQPPIVVGKPMRWFPKVYGNWLFASPLFYRDEAEIVYSRQWDVTPEGISGHENITLADIMDLEENYNMEGYSISRECQPEIEITTTTIKK